jgi:hypothetical protein
MVERIVNNGIFCRRAEAGARAKPLHLSFIYGYDSFLRKQFPANLKNLRLIHNRILRMP